MFSSCCLPRGIKPLRIWLCRSLSASTYGSFTDQTRRSLEQIVGESNISTSLSVREHHGKDESYHKCLPPDAVVFPTQVDQVSEVARFCNMERIPVIPFGTGTGLEGGVGAVKGGVCVDLSKMDQVLEVESEDFYATVQPGITRTALNIYLRDTGLWFPIDPGADASVCGMVATGASGTNAVRYGTMRENVLNLEVVLADGRVIHTAGTKGRAKKTSAGYNLTNLFVGSEGTLGIITQATVKIYGVPEATAAAVCSFPDVKSAVDTSVDILHAGIPIAKVEFLDDLAMKWTKEYFKLDFPVAPTLFLEFTGTQASVEEQAELAGVLARDNGGSDFIWEKDHEARARLWKARHQFWYAVLASDPGKKGYTSDVCVPVSKLPDAILKTKEDAANSSINTSIVCHAGDGNFHTGILMDYEDKEEVQRVKEFGKRMAQRAMEVGGTCTGEHGIGRGKMELLVEEHDPEAINVMKDLKRTLDPNNIMNPGKVFLDF